MGERKSMRGISALQRILRWDLGPKKTQRMIVSSLRRPELDVELGAAVVA